MKLKRKSHSTLFNNSYVFTIIQLKVNIEILPQNPGEGYYKEPTNPPGLIDLNTPETIIGTVRPCQCYGHSNKCDPETGHCLVR